METDGQRGGVTRRGRRDGGLQPDEDKVDLRERFRLEREEEEERRRQIGPPGGRDIDHLIIRFNKQSE